MRAVHLGATALLVGCALIAGALLAPRSEGGSAQPTLKLTAVNETKRVEEGKSKALKIGCPKHAHVTGVGWSNLTATGTVEEAVKKKPRRIIVVGNNYRGQRGPMKFWAQAICVRGIGVTIDDQSFPLNHR